MPSSPFREPSSVATTHTLWAATDAIAARMEAPVTVGGVTYLPGYLTETHPLQAPRPVAAERDGGQVRLHLMRFVGVARPPLPMRPLTALADRLAARAVGGVEQPAFLSAQAVFAMFADLPAKGLGRTLVGPWPAYRDALMQHLPALEAAVAATSTSAMAAQIPPRPGLAGHAVPGVQVRAAR